MKAEEEQLRAAQREEAALSADAAARLQDTTGSLAQCQEKTDLANAQLSELAARRNGLSRIIEDQRARLQRMERDIAEVRERRKTMLANAGTNDQSFRLSQAVESSLATALQLEQEATVAETEVRQARIEEVEARRAYDDARRAAERVETEVKTLVKLLRVSDGLLWPQLVDAVAVKPGFEAALGAALGDDPRRVRR